MDIAYSYPDNQGSDQASTTALDELNVLLDRLDIPLLDRIKSPGKTAAQIRQSKANKRTEETTQQEHAERVRQLDEWRVRESSRREQERQQQLEDQRVIADDIRNRHPLPHVTTQEPPAQAENWVSSSKLQRLLATRWEGVTRLCRNPADYPWSKDFRKPDPAYKGRYLWEAVGIAKEAEHRGLMKPEVSPGISEQCSSPQGLIVAFSAGGRG